MPTSQDRKRSAQMARMRVCSRARRRRWCPTFRLPLLLCGLLALHGGSTGILLAAEPLEVGFAHTDITPPVGADHPPVWLAGYHPGRQAAAVHDPLFARAVVLSDSRSKVALVSVDLIGLQYPVVQRIRSQLTDFRYVAVASTHNHEGPDVIGVWGPSYLQRGVSEPYVDFVVEQVVRAVRKAEGTLQEVAAAYGTAEDPSLLEDSRLPVVRDAVVRVLKFTAAEGTAPVGLIVQWNCHPEALGPHNTQVTADFPAWTIERLAAQFRCPVVYFSGALGGLMIPPANRIRDSQGRVLALGDFEFARQYGYAVADLAAQACSGATPIELAPFRVAAKPIGVPMSNELYRLARLMGVMRRDGYVWHPESRSLGEKLTTAPAEGETAVETEVACLQLGSLYVALLPGELYPELVGGAVEDPPQPGADFPSAPAEPSVVSILPGSQWLLLGLANDEIGYIIPKRQWDRRPPYAYGRSGPQYGEINSCSPDVASTIMHALQQRVAELHAPEQ